MRYLQIVILLMLLMLPVGCNNNATVQSQGVDEINGRIEEARKLFANGAKKEAIAVIDKVIADKPDYMPARLLRARVYESIEGQSENALNDLAYVITKAGDDYDALLRMANILINRSGKVTVRDGVQAINYLLRAKKANKPNEETITKTCVDVFKTDMGKSIYIDYATSKTLFVVSIEKVFVSSSISNRSPEDTYSRLQDVTFKHSMLMQEIDLLVKSSNANDKEQVASETKRKIKTFVDHVDTLTKD